MSLAIFRLDLSPSPASAQTGTAKTVQQLNTEVGTQLQTGSQIRAAQLRQVLLDMIASDLNLPSTPASPNQVFAGPASGSATATPAFRSLVLADLPPLPATGGGLTVYPVDNYGAKHDGTDDTVAIQSALNACATGNGGWVSLGPYRYLVSSDDITVPSQCMMWCPRPQQGTGDDPTLPQGLDPLTLQFTILIDPTHSVRFGQSAGWHGCNLLSSSLTINPVGGNARIQLNLLAQFGGTGMIIEHPDVYIYNAFIGGFNQGVLGTSRPNRMTLSHVSIDAINGVKASNVHDIGRLDHVEMYSYLNRGDVRNAWPIVAVTNNGGQYEVEINPTPTVGSASVVPQTGDYVWVDSSIQGAQSLYAGRYTAQVVDPTHVILPGTAFAGVTVTGDTTAGGLTIRNMSSNANIGTTGSITAPGVLASGTTVTWESQDGTMIGISKPALVDSTATSFTYADTAWVASTGKLWLNASYRSGTAFEFDSSEVITCNDCFAFSWHTGFHISNNSVWFQCLNCNVDGTVTGGVLIHEPSTLGFLLDGVSGGGSFSGGATTSVGTAVQINTSGTGSIGNSPAAFTGMNLNNSGNFNGTPQIEIDKGPGTFVGNGTAPNGRYVVVKDDATQVVFVGNNLKNFFGFESATAATAVVVEGNYDRVGGPSPSWGGVATATSGVFTATVSGRGSGYTPGDLILPDIDVALNGNVVGLNAFNSGAELIAVGTALSSAPTIVSGGSACTDGAVTITGTTGVGTKFTATATSTGGVLQSPITLVDGGAYTTNPTILAVEPVTGGTCVGVTVDLTDGTTTRIGARYLHVRNPGTYSIIKPGQTIRITDKNYAGTGVAATADLRFAAMAAALYPQNNSVSIGCYTCINLGYSSLASWTSGTANSGVGWIALRDVTTGSSNSAFGSGAGGTLTTGSANTMIGTSAMIASTTGSNNTAIGAGVLGRSTTGSQNTGLGVNTMIGDTGLTSVLTNNVAIGYTTMQNLSPGTLDNNIVIGNIAGAGMTTSDHNLIIGHAAGDTITTGIRNIILGHGVAGNTLATGSRNILIGTNTAGNCDTAGAATDDTFILCASTAGTHLMTGSLAALTLALTINGDLTIGNTKKFYITAPQTPASATATCTIGQIAWDTGFIYICTATDTWKRIAIATWP